MARRCRWAIAFPAEPASSNAPAVQALHSAQARSCSQPLPVQHGRNLRVGGFTLMTLWKMEDAPTVTFMESYYKRLKAGEGRADALRNTQRKFRNHQSFV